MTRLREALDRAQTLQNVPPASAGQAPLADAPLPEPWSLGASQGQPDPVDGWEFDGSLGSNSAAGAEEAARVTAVDAETPEAPSTEAAVQYPFVTPHTADKLVVGPEVESVFVEQYRRLGASLHHAQLKSGARTVMVTSAVESEGKTLTAANIALTLSHSYQRNVLLVDADLRRPSVHDVFKLSNKTGLGDTLTFGVTEKRLPIQQISPNLWVMTAGRPNSDPMGGLVSDTMRQFLIDATEQFDWVVVDTPPVALLTDANLLAAMIDLALIVVSAKTTPYPLVKRAIDAIGAQRVLGIVLNRAQTSEAAAGLGYGYGGYGYGYGYGNKSGPSSRQGRRRWRLPWLGRKSA